MKTSKSNLVQTVDWWERALPVFRPLPGHVRRKKLKVVYCRVVIASKIVFSAHIDWLK